MLKRVPLQVAPEFREVLRKLQGEIMLAGKSKSLREITREIAKSGVISIENIKAEITIKMDKRRKIV